MRKLFKLLKIIAGIIASLVGMTLFVSFIFINTSPEFGAPPTKTELNAYRDSPNFKEGLFQNQQETDVSGQMEWGRSLSEWFTDGDKVPNGIVPVNKISSKEVSASTDSSTKITWFGHSAILMEMEGKKVFLDPMLGSVPAPHSLLAGKRFNDTLPIHIEELPFLDAVLISHDHYDHLDYGSIVKIKDKVGHFYVPLGLGSHLESWGVASEKISELDWWETTLFQEIKFTAAPARHFSGRGINDRFKTQWCSWIIEGKKEKIYFSGDSGYDTHFSEIGNKYGPFDLAIMECGQYDPQWPLIHLMPEETVKATLDLQAKLMLPIHWGSFKLSLHAWDDPIERVTKAGIGQNVTIATPIIGETIILGQTPPQSVWWKKVEAE